MNKCVFSIGIILTLFGSFGCNETNTNKVSTNSNEIPSIKKNDAENVLTTSELNRDSFNDFIPEGFVLFGKNYGDLNNDGLNDCILIIKGTDKSYFFKDEYRGVIDRNRRGIIVLFKSNEKYELVMKNLNCFSSENEDGGIYFAPELSVYVNNGNLFVQYFHGRYGYWNYTFKFQNQNFELIGYELSDNRGPVVNRETSINYLTKKKIVNENTNDNAESGEEVFKETVTKINNNKLTKLSEIKDFDEFEVTED